MNTASPFLLDKEHQRILDGDLDALKKPHLRTIFIVAPILLAIGLYSSGGSISILLHTFELNTFGVAAKGAITDKKFEGAGSTSKAWSIFYSFVANDAHVYAQIAEVDGGPYYSLNIGDQVDVKYADGNPNDSRLNIYNPQERNTIGSGFELGLPCFGFAILGLTTAIMHLRGWRSLKAKGQVVEGRVLSIELDFKLYSGPYGYVVMRYEFYSPQNHKLIRRKVRLNYEQSYKEIAVGMPLAILYAHNHLYRVL